MVYPFNKILSYWLLEITTRKTISKGNSVTMLKVFLKITNGEHTLISTRVYSGLCVNRLEEMYRNFKWPC